MDKIELLAPAGSMESIYAAVQNGADAVYIGGTKFSARAYASNFDEENMIRALEYCHLYNVKVYVALNILIKEEEVNEALEYIKFLYKIGVDALIIQDTGIAELIKRNFPDFEIHASTQMTVHNGEGAILLNELGFKRIVLSRELSLKEIKYISKDLGIETEVFIHGALCICYSGQCLMSSIIGGRSGNRGRCAQPCRLPYEIINKKSGSVKKGYILSPKDICTLENIKDIIESGASSIKIEGRMKRPEYVAGVVSAYRKAIDEAYNTLGVSASKANSKDNALEKFNLQLEEKKLLQLFNRQGFSKAYIYGNVGKDMMAYNLPKNTGVMLGKVNKDLTIKLEEDINLQDGIRFGEDGFTIFKIVKGSENVSKAVRGDIVKLKPTKYKAGDILYKMLDTKLMEELSKTYSNIYEKKNLIDLSVKFKVNEPFTLIAVYNRKDYRVEGEIVQKALRKPIEKENLIKNLNKTGDTPFAFSTIHIDQFEEGFIPISTINAARRELIDKIQKCILVNEKSVIKGKVDLNIDDNLKKIPIKDSPIVVVTTSEQLRAVQKAGITNIAVDVFMKNCDIDLDSIKCENLYIKTSTIVKDEFNNVCELVEKNISKIKGIITSNLGVIRRFRDRTIIIGDYKLNIFNQHSLKFYSKIINGATISLELNKMEIGRLIKNALLPCYLMVYGNPELMVSEYCPIGSIFGGKNSENMNCTGECSKGNFVLKDRMGSQLPINTDKFCRSHIYNPVAINLIPNLEELRKLNINLFRLDFTNESYDETLNIIEDFNNGKFKGDFKNYTRGHFKRGVE